jgi:putative ABC transport system substrate-binding protein
VGYTAGLKAVDILKSGKKAGDIPSSLTKKLELVVNPKAANAQGLKLDPKFIEMADEIVE